MIELDSPGEVRKSEELNNLNLSFYLKKKLGHSRKSLVIKQFKKGFSNLTYSIIWDKNEYVLRKPPFGANIKSGHDMKREYDVLSNLSRYYNKVPKTYFFEDEIWTINIPLFCCPYLIFIKISCSISYY